jgi:hypothetical protein
MTDKMQGPPRAAGRGVRGRGDLDRREDYPLARQLATNMKSLGTFILITLICVVIFIVIMAVRPAPAQQGNMPKPLGKLPPYPPVVCVSGAEAFKDNPPPRGAT